MPESGTSPRAGRAFFAVGPALLARRLLGQRLVRALADGTRLAGTIVETEAYLGAEDRAAHTFGSRRTPRNEAMYGPPGTAYVYFTYGMHHCVNIVCGAVNEPVAVLLRALEPTEGLERMRTLRGLTPDAPATALCSGPGKLCAALGIDRALNEDDLTVSDGLWVERVRARALPDDEVANTPRIGVDSAQEWAAKPLRWYIRGNPHASRRRKGD